MVAGTLIIEHHTKRYIQNKLFRDCLAAIPAEQKAEFDLSFGIINYLHLLILMSPLLHLIIDHKV